MTELDDQIKALASASRMEILRLLAKPAETFADQESADPSEVGVCMNMIAERLGVSQPTASRHLDLLRRAGFITIEKRKKWSYCKRNDQVIIDAMMSIKEDLALAPNC